MVENPAARGGLTSSTSTKVMLVSRPLRPWRRSAMRSHPGNVFPVAACVGEVRSLVRECTALVNREL
eukprot:7285279-Prorocentrum_lima.AAC.1